MIEFNEANESKSVDYIFLDSSSRFVVAIQMWRSTRRHFVISYRITYRSAKKLNYSFAGNWKILDLSNVKRRLTFHRNILSLVKLSINRKVLIKAKVRNIFHKKNTATNTTGQSVQH